MCDRYKEGKGYWSFRIADLSCLAKDSWELAEDADFGKLKKRHGSILPITEDEYCLLEECFASKQ
jgi:hypothetical protein